MPNYEATPAELEKYGGNLSIWDQIRLLQAWAPLVGYAQRFVQTHAKVDDQLVSKLAAVLKTPAGEDLVRWVMQQVEAAR